MGRMKAEKELLEEKMQGEIRVLERKISSLARDRDLQSRLLSEERDNSSQFCAQFEDENRRVLSENAAQLTIHRETITRLQDQVRDLQKDNSRLNGLLQVWPQSRGRQQQQQQQGRRRRKYVSAELS